MLDDYEKPACTVFDSFDHGIYQYRNKIEQVINIIGLDRFIEWFKASVELEDEEYISMIPVPLESFLFGDRKDEVFNANLDV